MLTRMTVQTPVSANSGRTKRGIGAGTTTKSQNLMIISEFSQGKSLRGSQ